MDKGLSLILPRPASVATWTWLIEIADGMIVSPRWAFTLQRSGRWRPRAQRRETTRRSVSWGYLLCRRRVGGHPTTHSTCRSAECWLGVTSEERATGRCLER